MTRLVYISLGAGVQSSALLILSAIGRLGVPKAAAAIFADTGDEPAWVYDQVEALRAWSTPRGIPVEVVSAGTMSADMQIGFVRIPAFTLTAGEPRAGMLRRQCTREYKIRPIQDWARARLGYRPRQRIPAGSATAMIGISCDEVSRCAPSQEPWIEKVYPLIDAGLYRAQCLRIVEEAGFPTPRKSACVYCPYHSDRFWMRLKLDDPEEFARAVAVDEQIRNLDRQGIKKAGIHSPIYLHRSCKPLAEVDFGDQPDLWEEECEGVCGV